MTVSTAHSHSELMYMMYALRQLPQVFWYGTLPTGERCTATLDEELPLLVLDGPAPGMLHKRLVFALLAQFYAKRWDDAPHIVLMEQHQALTPLVRDLSRTLFVTTSPRGILEGVGYLNQALQERQKNDQARPNLLVVLEVTYELQRHPAWSDLYRLLEQGQAHGIFFIAVAVPNGCDTDRMPHVFHSTILMRAFTRQRTNDGTASLELSYSLSRSDLREPVQVVIPLVDPTALKEWLCHIAEGVAENSTGGHSDTQQAESDRAVSTGDAEGERQ